ncbi:MAG: DUF1579 family protein [Planctomycetota bacterium]|jgi:hypothetical protein
MSKFEQSKIDGPHALLARMVGDWEGSNKTWFDGPELSDESRVAGSIRLIQNGMFILHEYQGKLAEHDMIGTAIIGYSFEDEQWQCAWVDTCHNGTRIMVSKGDKGDTGTPNVQGDFPAPPDPNWGWRTTFDLKDDNHLLIQHFCQPPEGKGDEYLGVEFDYARKS